MILRDGVRMAAAGVVLGLGGALLLAGVMRGMTFDLNPYDPLGLAGAAIVLTAAALAASYLPARRALKSSIPLPR